ncbi:MAG: arylesterase [Deltaproteobacteria bacterium]|nr:arylesterase [Deltaproteobacteria bacterium]|tara:strand:+ start:1848 stop:2483 length:636 start_codon:yes stop_codon:yes gene_type:complete
MNFKYFFKKILLPLLVAFNLSVLHGHSNAQTLIVTLGDSLTEGFGVSREEAYPHLVEQELIRKGYSVRIVNAGISGSTSASAPSRMQWFLRVKPDIVILALGGNDGLRGLSLKHMKKNLGKAIKLAISKNIKVLLAGMQIPLNYGQDYTKSFKSTFYELAEKYDLPLIPFLLKDVGNVPILNLPDGIHPNPEGHKIISQTVIEHLEPLLLN